MWLSATAQQALRAVVYLADHSTAAPVRVDAVARALKLPRNYLSKTLNVLAAEGVLSSRRGQRGGFQLAMPADRLTLAMIVAPFSSAEPQRCLLSEARCNARRPCPVHSRWAEASRHIDAFLGISVAEVLQSTSRARPPNRS